jgi:hypothetical protein
VLEQDLAVVEVGLGELEPWRGRRPSRARRWGWRGGCTGCPRDVCQCPEKK